uniref:Uncharacterized protein n=1 Tax=Arundo donax TaxID=35708 RepID=A0A0A9B0H2_ARUDO
MFWRALWRSRQHRPLNCHPQMLLPLLSRSFEQDWPLVS